MCSPEIPPAPEGSRDKNRQRHSDREPKSGDIKGRRPDQPHLVSARGNDGVQLRCCNGLSESAARAVETDANTK